MNARLTLKVPTRMISEMATLSRQVEQQRIRPNAVHEALFAARLDLEDRAQTLSSWCSAARMGRLHQQLWPDDWLGTDDSTRILEGMSRREYDLLERLDRFFPVDGYIVDSWFEDGREARPPVPARIMSLDVGGELEPDEYSLPIVLLAYLLCVWDPATASEHITTMGFPHALPDISDDPVDWRWFVRQCRRNHLAQKSQPSASVGYWEYVPAAIHVVAQETGNAFLDARHENGWEFVEWADEGGWCVRNIHWLARVWARARRFLEKLKAVEAWLMDNPEAWLEIAALWTEAQRRCAVEVK